MPIGGGYWCIIASIMQPFTWDFPYPSQRMPVLARNVVATSQPLAAQAGLRMMQTGGNAVDAAVATAIALTVLEPTSNGIGSDAFCILWDGKRLHGLNANGRSPAAWNPERFKGHTVMPSRGWDAVTVPGAVSAWAALSERFGKLPFTDLFEPAIDYAAGGFMVSPTIARLWAKQVPELRDVPGFAEHFMPRGRAPEAGEKFLAPAHARALKRIAETRGKAFYEGELAEEIAAHAKKHGGAMTVSDLAAHTADWVAPVAHPYRGYTVHEIPPATQGIGTLMALGMLEGVHQPLPARQIGGRGVQAQLPAHDVVQLLRVQHGGDLVDAVHIHGRDHGFHRDHAIETGLSHGRRIHRRHIVDSEWLPNVATNSERRTRRC